MKNCVGFIAEDESDVQVVNEIIKKVVPGKKYSFHSFFGHGCGKILGKCFQWAHNLKIKGCSILIVIHDLDDKNINELQAQLHNSLRRCAIPNHLIVIPIREIEAWLLSDNQAIEKAMKLSMKVENIPDPQMIDDPKRRLAEIIYYRSGKTKRYINSVHNQRIAALLDLSHVRRCESFIPLEEFVQQQIK